MLNPATNLPETGYITNTSQSYNTSYWSASESEYFPIRTSPTSHVEDVSEISGHSLVFVTWSSRSHLRNEIEASDYTAANMKQTITTPLSRL